jgi:hypothetical protein
VRRGASADRPDKRCEGEQGNDEEGGAAEFGGDEAGHGVTWQASM